MADVQSVVLRYCFLEDGLVRMEVKWKKCVLWMRRSPTQGKDPYDVFNVASGKARSSDNPPVIPPRLSPESTTPPARSLFSDGLLARLSQDPNLARFLKSSSSSSSSDANNSSSRGNGGQQQTAPSSLFGRRISIESLPLRR